MTEEPKWKTQDGRILTIGKMENGHLYNAIMTMRVRHRQVAWLIAFARTRHMVLYAATAPVGAGMAMESEVDRMFSQAGLDEILGEKHYAFNELLREADKRKMEIYK